MFGPNSYDNIEFQKAKREAALKALTADPVGAAERQAKVDTAFWGAEGQAKAGGQRAAVEGITQGSNEAAARPQEAALAALKEAGETGRNDATNATALGMNTADNTTRMGVANRDAETRVGVANIGAASDKYGYDSREREGKYATDGATKRTGMEVDGNKAVAGIEAGTQNRRTDMGALTSLLGQETPSEDSTGVAGNLAGKLGLRHNRPPGAGGGPAAPERTEGQQHPTKPDLVWSTADNGWVKKEPGLPSSVSLTPGFDRRWK